MNLTNLPEVDNSDSQSRDVNQEVGYQLLQLTTQVTHRIDELSNFYTGGEADRQRIKTQLRAILIEQLIEEQTHIQRRKYCLVHGWNLTHETRACDTLRSRRSRRA